MGEEIELPRRRLGKTDIDLTVFGVGGYLGLLVDKQGSTADGEHAAILAVRRALELGVGYFCYRAELWRWRGRAAFGFGVARVVGGGKGPISGFDEGRDASGKEPIIRCRFNTVVAGAEFGAAFL